MANGSDFSPLKPRPRTGSHGDNAGRTAVAGEDCARGAVRFSLDGHELLVIQDMSPKHDEAVTTCLAAGSTRVAGCVFVGGGTYTIFSLDQLQPEDVRPRQRDIEFLTQRELQIAILVMQGQVNKQIAHRLHIAPNTVQSHLKRIFCKLGVTSRAAMVARVAGCMRWSEGLYTPP